MSEGRFPWEAGMPVLKLFDAGDVLLEGDGDVFLLGVSALRNLSLVLLWACPQEGFPLRLGCVPCARECHSDCGRALSVSEQRQGRVRQSAGRAEVDKGPSSPAQPR